MVKMLISGLFLFIMSLLFMFFGMSILMFNKILILEWMIFNMNKMKMNFILVISFKLLMFTFLVLLVSSMIFMYSVSYMDLDNELYINRFYY